MLKAIFAGTTALTLLGGSLVYAQTAAPPAQPGVNATQPNTTGTQPQRPHMTAEERAALTDARITELKTELKLTAAQQKMWPTFETALRDTAKQRTVRFEQASKTREQSEGAQRPDRNAAATPEEIAEQKKIAAALDPLYKSFDDGQKQKFGTMFRVDGEGRHFWFRGGRRS